MAPANNFSASSTIDWDKVRIFYVAADAGSFTHAGDVLQISQSAVSRQVSALERDLGVPPVSYTHLTLPTILLV